MRYRNCPRRKYLALTNLKIADPQENHSCTVLMTLVECNFMRQLNASIEQDTLQIFATFVQHLLGISYYRIIVLFWTVNRNLVMCHRCKDLYHMVALVAATVIYSVFSDEIDHGRPRITTIDHELPRSRTMMSVVPWFDPGQILLDCRKARK